MTIPYPIDPEQAAAEEMPANWLIDHRAVAAKARPPKDVAVIYARYSTARQNETSVERQVEICADHVERSGFTLLRGYADRARSGTTVVGRDALEEMLDAARRGEFGILVVENVDRLARDLSILATVFKLLQALGIEMHQPGRGRLGLPDIAFHGFMGEEGRRLFLERVQAGRIKQARLGHVQVKPSYGYALVAGQRGKRVVIEERAEVVRRIFRMRGEGLSVRQIVNCLNKEPDRDRDWCLSAIQTILTNTIYAGFYVYNRTVRMPDPDGGRPKVVPRPRSEWVVVHVDQLKIVEPAVWEAAQSPLGGDGAVSARKHSNPLKYLLSGKLRCPNCDGGMTIVGKEDQRRFVCTDNRQGGRCQGTKSIKIDELERFVVGLVADNVLHPGCAEAYVAAYEETRAKSSKDHEATATELRRRLDVLNRSLDATFDETLMDGMPTRFLVEKRRSIAAMVENIEHALAAMPPTPRPVGIDRGRMTLLRDAIAGFRERAPFLPEDEADHRLAAAFRKLVRHIVVRRTAYGRFDAEVHLTVMPLLRAEGFASPAVRGDMCLRGSYRLRPRTYVTNNSDVVSSYLSEGRFALRENEWEAIRHLLPDEFFHQTNRQRPWDARKLVEAHLFVLMHGVPWTALPPRFGPHQHAYLGAAKLTMYGVWREVVEILTRIDPERYEARFADATWMKVHGNQRVSRLVEERRAAEAAALR